MRSVDAWIAEQRAEKRWCQPCLSCGTWFSVPRKGKRAILCKFQRCAMWRKYQTRYGRAPPPRLIASWAKRYGNADRTIWIPKTTDERRFVA